MAVVMERTGGRAIAETWRSGCEEGPCALCGAMIAEMACGYRGQRVRAHPRCLYRALGGSAPICPHVAARARRGRKWWRLYLVRSRVCVRTSGARVRVRWRVWRCA